MVCIDTSVVITVRRVTHLVIAQLSKVVAMSLIVVVVGIILLEEQLGKVMIVMIVAHKQHVQHELMMPYLGMVINQAYVGNGLTHLVHVVRWQEIIKKGKRVLTLTLQALLSVVMEFVGMMKLHHLVHLTVATKLIVTVLLHQVALQLAVESRVAVWKRMMDRKELHSMPFLFTLFS